VDARSGLYGLLIAGIYHFNNLKIRYGMNITIERFRIVSTVKCKLEYQRSVL
jgi:hypothetical protein